MYRKFKNNVSQKGFSTGHVPPEVRIICGLDEAGRGPWAGPLVTCALVFKKKRICGLKGVKDSKKLTEQKREDFFSVIGKIAVYGVGIAEVTEIDTFGLTKATKLAFLRALENLPMRPDFLLIDGRDKFQLPYAARSIIKGDEKIKIITCAGIVAKVTRDRIMRKLALQYPQYGFERHKGYGTARHARALKKNGICPIHRKSFSPVAQIINDN